MLPKSGPRLSVDVPRSVDPPICRSRSSLCTDKSGWETWTPVRRRRLGPLYGRPLGEASHERMGWRPPAEPHGLSAGRSWLRPTPRESTLSACPRSLCAREASHERRCVLLKYLKEFSREVKRPRRVHILSVYLIDY